MAGTSPAMTKWDCCDFCPFYGYRGYTGRDDHASRRRPRASSPSLAVMMSQNRYLGPGLIFVIATYLTFFNICGVTRLDRRRNAVVRKRVLGVPGALALIAWALPAHAQATNPVVELAFMPQTMTVTLLNEGGKYVVVDLKHIPQGGTCRMDKDATIMRVGPGATPETTRVRYAAAQVSAGGCPFLTIFDMANADYAAGRAAFVKMEDEASKKVEEVKKEIGEKWDEIFGKKE